jgi:hypothetical protein
MVETAGYETIREEGEYEVRIYDKLILATVENFSGSPFNVLFKYISGANLSEAKIAMTSPVISSEKIPMTSPVISTSNSMSFVLPSKYSIQDAPQPTDKRVSIEEIPERYVATVKFRGIAWKDKVRDQTEKLLEWVSKEDFKAKGKPFLMQYNPPYIPGFLRRNEIGIEIDYQSNNTN